MVDVEALLVGLVGAGFPAADVSAAVDTESIERLPLITLQAVNGEAINAHRLGDEWQVDVTVIGVGRDAARQVAAEVRDFLHALKGRPQGRVEGVGAVAGVDDISLPTRTATGELDAQHLHQFDAAYRVRVQPA